LNSNFFLGKPLNATSLLKKKEKNMKLKDACVLIVIASLISCQIIPFIPRTFAQTSHTLTGKVLYHGKPVSNFTEKLPSFWVRNESSGEVASLTFDYDPSTSKYFVYDVLPGQYGINVYVDAVESSGGYAGDFDGWITPIDIPQDQPVVNFDLEVQKIIHLVNPIDNAKVLGSMSDLDSYLQKEIVFRWDPIPEAVLYTLKIEEIEEPYQIIKDVVSIQTNMTEWKPELSLSEDNRFYLFTLYAYDTAQKYVGKLMIVYSNGYGWDYRFRIVESISTTTTSTTTTTTTPTSTTTTTSTTITTTTAPSTTTTTKSTTSTTSTATTSTTSSRPTQTLNSTTSTSTTSTTSSPITQTTHSTTSSTSHPSTTDKPPSTSTSSSTTLTSTSTSTSTTSAQPTKGPDLLVVVVSIVAIIIAVMILSFILTKKKVR
jgi:hypothetical protein